MSSPFRVVFDGNVFFQAFLAHKVPQDGFFVTWKKAH
jgi:hypothetical protein